MAFDAKVFRRALGQFATGVTVVTLYTGEGEVHGMTANAFSSVSLDPPLVLVCVDKRNTTHRLVEEVGRFAINILSEEQTAVSRHFAGERELDPGFGFASSEAQSPIIEGVLGWLDCRLWKSYDGGDHTIFVGEVERLSVSGGRPLIFFGGDYGRLS